MCVDYGGCVVVYFLLFVCDLFVVGWCGCLCGVGVVGLFFGGDDLDLYVCFG